MSCTTDEAMLKLCEVMRDRYCAGPEFELALGDLVGKYRQAHEKRMRDKQAADLLPLGRRVAADRLGVAPSTVYKMTQRYRKTLSTDNQAA
jgi:hypothetical protein